MSDAILVLNAGSSSIKYSVFVDNSAGPELLLRGQLEGLHTSPRFEAKDAKGTLVSERRWKEGEALGHGRVYEGTPLSAEDIAETVHWIASRPAHINVNAIALMPVCQAFGPFAIHREKPDRNK